jgi:hypothetical protein
MRNEVRDGFPLEDFAEAWNGHRKRKQLMWALFLGWLPFGAFVIGGLERWGLNWAVFPAFGLYFIALMVASNKASNFRCPRCDSRFYAWGPWGMGHNGFARKCGNCQLSKWQCQSEGQAQETLSELDD